LAAPPPVPGEEFVEVGGLVDVDACELDGGGVLVLGVDEGFDVVGTVPRVGVAFVHDGLPPGLGVGGTVFLPVWPGVELVVPGLGDVEGEVEGDVEGLVFGLPLGLLVGCPVPLGLAPGEELPLELGVLPPLGVPRDELTGGVVVRVVLPCVPVLEDVTGGLEDDGAQGLGVR
jgi:hypothetical protein